MLHHVEIYVGELERSAAFWTPFMQHLGWEAERWSGGINYVRGPDDPYLCFLPAPAQHLAAGYHRQRVGLNHLAFRARSRAHVDEITTWLQQAGHPLLYADRHPWAGGPGYYALYCEDPDRIKVEVAAPRRALDEARAAADGGAVLVREALPSDRAALQQLLELYQYELSDIWQQPLDDQGRYGYALQRFFEPAGRSRAFLAVVAGEPAGFALADDAVKLAAAGHWMDQFFVLRRHRGRGIGGMLARTAFEALPGHWEVGQMAANLQAQAFWRRCIGRCTGGHYTEQRLDSGRWQGLIQSFDWPPA